MKLNSAVNYFSADFNVAFIAENGDVILRPVSKNLKLVTVEEKYVKHIYSGHCKSRR